MATPEPSLCSVVANVGSTWPCVLDRCHVGTSKYVPCAASGLMSANFTPVFADSMLHSSFLQL